MWREYQLGTVAILTSIIFALVFAGFFRISSSTASCKVQKPSHIAHMANGYKPKAQVVRSPGNMKQCTHCRFGNPEDAKFCRRAAKRSGTLEGFAVDAAADARPGPVLHVAARRGGAGQFHRQARPPLGLDSCHDRADAAHVAGYRADLRSDSWRVRRLAW